VRYVILLLLAPIAGLAQPQQCDVFSGHARHAFVIGNGKYDKLPPAPKASADLKAMTTALQSARFTVTAVEDAAMPDLFQKDQTQFLDTIQPGDVVFFYYSGHIVRGPNEDDLILPRNYDPSTNVRESGIAFSVSNFLDLVYGRKPSLIMVMIEGPHPIGASITGQVGEAGLVVPGALNKDTLFAMSADTGRIVASETPAETSRFTAAFMDALLQPGQHPAQVFVMAGQTVKADTDRAQSPRIEELQTPFCFLPPVKIGPKPGDRRINPTLSSLNDAWIPPGTFQMGCVPQDKQCKPEEKPRHPVTITQGFWMTTTEITLQAYMQFLERNPSHPTPRQTKTNLEGRVSNSPQTDVTWQDAEDYCAWAGGAGGRLPTEAEWEYAARGGKDGLIYPWGDNFDPDIVNSWEKPKKKRRYDSTTPVDLYNNNPNGFHLLGMAGNAREWTQDLYDKHSYEGAGPSVDPFVQKSPENERVVRGGDFNETRDDLRVSARGHRPPGDPDNRTGFRCISREATQATP
jgi:formylglycine-generating enzyme required for sulfatase activity